MRKKKMTKLIHRVWKEWRLTIFLIIFVIIPVKSSLADWNWVPSGSMNPTILEGELVFVNKIAYGLRVPLTLHRLLEWSSPERGDIVICFSPEDGMRLVKRLIGKPGEVIAMKDNRLFINGEAINYTMLDAKYGKYLSGKLQKRSVFAEEYLDGLGHAVMAVPSVMAIRNFGPVTVPDDCYFVMGDNRDMSKDSRLFGFVQRKSIIGKAEGVILSFDVTDNYQPRWRRFFNPLK
jgi:signal peptidase I